MRDSNPRVYAALYIPFKLLPCVPGSGLLLYTFLKVSLVGGVTFI